MVSARQKTGETLRRILAGLAEHGGKAAELPPEVRLREDLGLDSVAMVDLMVEVEGSFGVYFDPYLHDFTLIFRTVGSLEEFLALAGGKE